MTARQSRAELARVLIGVFTTLDLERDYAPMGQFIASLPHREQMDKSTKKQLRNELLAAHAALDALGVDRGDANGAWPLAERIRRLADVTADVRRTAHRLLHGEE